MPKRRKNEVPPMGPFSGPARVDDALVVRLQGRDAARTAVKHLESAVDAPGTLDRLLRYVTERGAQLVPLYPERGETIGAGKNWRLVTPEMAAPRGGLSGAYVLNLPSPEDTEWVERLVAEEGGNDLFAYRPPVRYPVDVPPPIVPPAALARQWALGKCKFPDVWPRLDAGEEPGRPIAIIDKGSNPGHRELKGRLRLRGKPHRGAPSRSIHAGAVAGVIAAIRDDDETGMAGCCSAKLHLYNAWRNDGFDACAYFLALKRVAAERPAVLNLSMGSPDRDDLEEELIRECLANDVVVVAAAGNHGRKGPPEMFPAAYDGVIAVAATNEGDGAIPASGRGPHVRIAAPGEFILTLKGRDEFEVQSGTSYATAIVSAAVWLARRRKPCLGVDEIRALLQESTDPATVPTGERSDDVGYGRLDMSRLEAALEAARGC